MIRHESRFMRKLALRRNGVSCTSFVCYAYLSAEQASRLFDGARSSGGSSAHQAPRTVHARVFKRRHAKRCA